MGLGAWRWARPFPGLSLYVLGLLFQKIHSGTYRVLPLIPGSLGTSFLSLRDLLKVHEFLVKNFFLKGKAVVTLFHSRNFYSGMAISVGTAFLVSSVGVSPFHRPHELVCLLNSSVGMDHFFPFWYSQLITYLACKRRPSTICWISKTEANLAQIKYMFQMSQSSGWFFWQVELFYIQSI